METIPCAAIDVGLIVYDERAIVGTAIESLVSAGFDRFVILDMQSTDGTTEFLRERLGERATIIDFPRRSLIEYGFAEARNTCSRFGTREWLLFVDADEVLTGGVVDRHVQITRTSANANLFSIERHNLSPDTARETGAPKVQSVENHNRLYKPSLRLRYAGYIHEEIHAGLSPCRDAGGSALVFDHYGNLKPVPEAKQKAALYALMLWRAYNQPDVRAGMDAWWFDQYIPTFLTTVRDDAEALARQLGLPPSFYAPPDSKQARKGFLRRR